MNLPIEDARVSIRVHYFLHTQRVSKHVKAAVVYPGS